MLFTHPTDLLTPSPLHLLLLLIVLTVFAFRASGGSPLRRWRFVLLFATAWCWLAATPVLAHWLGRQLEEQYAPLDDLASLPPDPVIIVLASGDPFEDSMPDALQLNLAAYRRTAEAARLWHRAGGTLLFAGTINSRESRSVAERMAILAENLGVPRKYLCVETESLNTYENLRNAVPLIEACSATPSQVSVVLVTSAMHMPRAMAVAHELGLRPVAAPADFRAKPELGWRAWLPNSRSLILLRLVLHEGLGRAYYELRGWT